MYSFLEIFLGLVSSLVWPVFRSVRPEFLGTGGDIKLRVFTFKKKEYVYTGDQSKSGLSKIKGGHCSPTCFVYGEIYSGLHLANRRERRRLGGHFDPGTRISPITYNLLIKGTDCPGEDSITYV